MMIWWNDNDKLKTFNIYTPFIKLQDKVFSKRSCLLTVALIKKESYLKVDSIVALAVRKMWSCDFTLAVGVLQDHKECGLGWIVDLQLLMQFFLNAN